MRKNVFLRLYGLATVAGVAVFSAPAFAGPNPTLATTQPAVVASKTIPPSVVQKVPTVTPALAKPIVAADSQPQGQSKVPEDLKECMTLLKQTSKSSPALIKSVATLVAQAGEAEAATDLAQPSMMIVSYREQRGGVSDVVVQVLRDPLGDSGGILQEEGHIKSRLGSDLTSSADGLMGLLYHQASFFGQDKQIHRQQRAFESMLNGDPTLLREQTIEPLRVVAVMPHANEFLPGSLRSRVSGIVVNGELAFGEWKAKVGLVTEDEETAEQVGNIVAAWRDMAASLADVMAGHSSGKPLREAIKASTVEIVDNQVIASAALPSATIVRATKEFTGHAPPKKVTLCHNGNTITVSENAVQAHLAHGDTLGPCEGGGNPPGRPKGNNGVGNGIDPQPPGNPPINDGPGTGPGNPGNRGR